VEENRKMPIDDDSASLLVVVLDLNAQAWLNSALSLDQVVNELCLVLKTHLLLRQRNQVAVIACSCENRYSTPGYVTLP